jgi:hypothetical protein
VGASMNGGVTARRVVKNSIALGLYSGVRMGHLLPALRALHSCGGSVQVRTDLACRCFDVFNSSCLPGDVPDSASNNKAIPSPNALGIVLSQLGAGVRQAESMRDVVVELGTGNAAMLFPMCPPVADIVCFGSDFADVPIAHAKKFIPHIFLDVGRTRAPLGKASAVLSNSVLMVLDGDAACGYVEEGLRLLRPGGVFFLQGAFNLKFVARFSPSFFVEYMDGRKPMVEVEGTLITLNKKRCSFYEPCPGYVDTLFVVNNETEQVALKERLREQQASSVHKHNIRSTVVTRSELQSPQGPRVLQFCTEALHRLVSRVDIIYEDDGSIQVFPPDFAHSGMFAIRIERSGIDVDVAAWPAYVLKAHRATSANRIVFEDFNRTLMNYTPQVKLGSGVQREKKKKNKGREKR